MTVKLFGSNVAFMNKDLEQAMVDVARTRLCDAMQEINSVFLGVLEVGDIKEVARRVGKKEVEEKIRGDFRKIAAFAKSFEVTKLGVVWFGKGEPPNNLGVTCDGRMVAVIKHNDELFGVDVSDEEVISNANRFCFFRREDIDDEIREIRYRSGLVAEYKRRLNK